MTTHTYKETSTRSLNLDVFFPLNISDSVSQLPAILMFHGGGWEGGEPEELEAYCHYFADQGYVTVSASYRLMGRDQTTPFEAVDDAEDAYKFIINHAEELHIDRQNIVVMGGSAGGHLAFWVVKRQINQNFPPIALILLSAVLDTSPQGYGFDKLKERFIELSPLEHISSDLPSTLIIHSEIDSVVPFKGVELFYQQLQQYNVLTQIYTENIDDHGFYVFNPSSNLQDVEFIPIITQFIHNSLNK